VTAHELLWAELHGKEEAMSNDAADTRPGSGVPSLVIISGSHRGRRIPVPSTGIVLGREGKLGSLFCDDPLVSLGHAHAYVADDASVQVADLNSTNGTFVNGKAIHSLTRLADRDVLRIGSIDMRLDSPRGDIQPADETVIQPNANPSWPDPRAERRIPPEKALRREGSQGPSAGAGWPGNQAEAHYGQGEAAPASATFAAPEVGAPAPAETAEPVSFAPHQLRLLAFTIDLLLVAAAAGVAAAVTGSLLMFAAVLLAAWVIYQTGSVWLTGGRTVGKAACNLSVRHIDGSIPRQDRAGLTWAFGRASLGYLVIDMGGLGVLVALRSPRRRCLHDYAFASEVVLHPDPDPDDPLHPRSRLERIRRRLQQFTEDRENAWEAKKKKYAFIDSLWKWLLRITEISLGWLLFLRNRWHALVRHFAAHAHPTTSAPTAKALSAGKITALVAATSVATGTAVAVATTAYLSAPIVGSWGAERVARVGVQSYQGTAAGNFEFSATGCKLSKGQEVDRISGHGQHYTGYRLWSSGRDGQDCSYMWGPAVFDLISTNTLKICSIDPFPGRRHQECFTVNRVATR
jgi:uncharacterized RDD family membrane protein YckC